MALELCPRAVLLDAGRVVADGPTRDVLADEPLLERHGLEVPLSLKLGHPSVGSAPPAVGTKEVEGGAHPTNYGRSPARRGVPPTTCA